MVMDARRRELREIRDQEFRKVVGEQTQAWRSKMRQRMYEQSHREMVNYLVFRNVPEEYRKPLRGIR
jgi:hypothetical protein